MQQLNNTGGSLWHKQEQFLQAREEAYTALDQLSINDPRACIKVGDYLHKAEAANEIIHVALLTKLRTILHKDSNNFRNPNDFVKLYAQYLSYVVANISDRCMGELYTDTKSLYTYLRDKLSESWLEQDIKVFSAGILLSAISRLTTYGMEPNQVKFMITDCVTWLSCQCPILATYTAAQIYQGMGESSNALHYYNEMLQVYDYDDLDEPKILSKDEINLKIATLKLEIVTLEIDGLETNKGQVGNKQLADEIQDILIDVSRAYGPNEAEPIKKKLFLDTWRLQAKLHFVQEKYKLAKAILDKHPELLQREYHAASAAWALDTQINLMLDKQDSTKR